jgi:hypothetical protein
MRLPVFAVLFALLLPALGESDLGCRKIPFECRDGLIWLKVDLAGKKKPLNFLLDSGSSASVIDLKTAQICEIHLGARQSVTGINGQDVAYVVDGFQAKVSDLPLPKSILAIDLENVSASCHERIDGILGFDFFRNRILRIDFNAGEVVLLKNCDPNPAKCDILPMRITNGVCCVPVRIAGNGEQWLRFDTGCDSALEWVVPGTGKGLRNGASIGLANASVNRVNVSVRLGNDCFDHIAAGIHSKQIFAGESGLIGNGLLSKFCLTIDEPERRVIFEKVR